MAADRRDQPDLPAPEAAGDCENQGDQVLRADVARTQFAVNGAGVTVGVLSDSVNRLAGGLADSVRTGDLPANVTVLQDLVGPGGTDEGRAMLEQIHDIAPGASLAFSTGLRRGADLRLGIRALATQAGAQVIVDDVGRADEPFFQDGIIAQAVTDVVRNNRVTYFSSAGNSADHGYESDFRPATATVGASARGASWTSTPGRGS
jgi:hypothetical protein